jgi:hypothetical protein
MSTKQKIVYYTLGVGGLIVVGGGLYYLYKYLTEISEEEQELKKKLIDINENEIFDSNNQLKDEGVIKIIIKINHLSDYLFEKQNPDLDERRRNVIDKEEEYIKLFADTLAEKKKSYDEAAEMVLNSLTIKINFDLIQQKLNLISPENMEKFTLEFDELDEKEKNLNEETAKNAFIYYANQMNEQGNKLKEKIEALGESIDQNQQLMEFLIIKMKIDDLMYIKYQTSMQSVKLFLYKNNLLNDESIKEAKEILEKIEAVNGNNNNIGSDNEDN